MNVSNIYAIWIKHFCTLSLILVSCCLYSQDSSITYFDENWNEVSSEEDAEYYRKGKMLGKRWAVTDYYIEGGIQMTGFFTSPLVLACS